MKATLAEVANRPARDRQFNFVLDYGQMTTDNGRQWFSVCLQEARSRQLSASGKEQDISEAVKLNY